MKTNLISDVIGYFIVVGTFGAVTWMMQVGFNKQSKQNEAVLAEVRLFHNDTRAFLDRNEKAVADIGQNVAHVDQNVSAELEASSKLVQSISQQVTTTAQKTEQAAQEAALKTVEVAKEAKEKAPVVIEKHTIEHHTEVISDSELRRREKAKAQWDKYRQDKVDWDKKYGKKKH